MSDRERRNQNVRECRQRKKREDEERRTRTQQLREENGRLEVNIQALEAQREFLETALNALMENRNADAEEADTREEDKAQKRETQD